MKAWMPLLHYKESLRLAGEKEEVAMQQKFTFSKSLKQKILDDMYFLRSVVNTKKIGRFRRGSCGVIQCRMDTIEDKLSVRVTIGKRRAFQKISGKKHQYRPLFDISKVLKKWRSISLT
jgi:hypothetical protein